MNHVFEKTRELGEALMQSEEYIAMKKAEEKAMANAEAAYTMGQLIETRQKVEKMLAESEPDAEALKTLSAEMDGCQERLQMIDDIRELTEARGQFSGLIEQVNRVLKFIITGEMDEEEDEDGCTGSCDSCGGACHHHHLN